MNHEEKSFQSLLWQQDMQRGQIDALIGICASLIAGHSNRQGIMASLKDRRDQAADQTPRTARETGACSVAETLLSSVEKLVQLRLFETTQERH